MPIQGITDRESVKPRWPRLGKLRKGNEKKANRPGEDLEYFRLVTDRPEIVEAFKEAYGEQPDVIPLVYLPYSTPDENFETWMEEWAASGLIHRCDGETCTVHRQDDGSFRYDSIPCPYADGKKKRTKSQPGCQPTGRLALILPDLIRPSLPVGTITLETHSKHDLMNVIAVLWQTYEKRSIEAPGKGLQEVPFTLRRYKDRISTPSNDGNGGRVRREKWLVELAPIPTWVESRLALESSIIPALDAGADYEPDDDDNTLSIDPETGEILGDNGSNGDEWGDIEAAKLVRTDQGTLFGDLYDKRDTGKFQWIIDHPNANGVTQDMVKAAEILIGALMDEDAAPEQEALL